jgi:hypothetical protein
MRGAGLRKLMAATRSLLGGDGVIKGIVYGLVYWMFDEGVRCRGLWRVFIRTRKDIGRRGWSAGMGSMYGMIRRGWCASG